MCISPSWGISNHSGLSNQVYQICLVCCFLNKAHSIWQTSLKERSCSDCRVYNPGYIVLLNLHRFPAIPPPFTFCPLYLPLFPRFKMKYMKSCYLWISNPLMSFAFEQNRYIKDEEDRGIFSHLVLCVTLWLKTSFSQTPSHHETHHAHIPFNIYVYMYVCISAGCFNLVAVFTRTDLDLFGEVCINIFLHKAIIVY